MKKHFFFFFYHLNFRELSFDVFICVPGNIGSIIYTPAVAAVYKLLKLSSQRVRTTADRKFVSVHSVSLKFN